MEFLVSGNGEAVGVGCGGDVGVNSGEVDGAGVGVGFIVGVGVGVVSPPTGSPTGYVFPKYIQSRYL